MKVLMHYNPGLRHQVEHAAAFEQSGIGTTTDIKAAADVHIVSGPHYALNHWRGHPRVVWLDRAWWADPVFVSLGWMQPDGTRRFAVGDEYRPRPAMMKWKRREQSALVLADFGEDVSAKVAAAKKRFPFVRVRRHPAEVAGSPSSLGSAIMLADVVIGHGSTALVEAAIFGRPVVCTDNHSAVAPVASSDINAPLYRGPREEWLHKLSWGQWSLAEIAAGAAMEELWRVSL